jgi:hypothetical protein
MVIRAIEKYGAFSKKKKSLKKRFRHKLHLGPSDEEEKQAEDRKRNEKIEREAKRKERESKETPSFDDGDDHDVDGKQNRKGPVDRHHADTDEEDDSGKNCKTGDVKADMHDGMKKEDMTDQERAERAVALIRSAFSKGLKGEKKEILQDASGAGNYRQSEDTEETQNRAKEERDNDGKS